MGNTIFKRVGSGFPSLSFCLELLSQALEDLDTMILRDFPNIRVLLGLGSWYFISFHSVHPSNVSGGFKTFR